jgi:CTP synthase (UTP-ammonia lyase)
MEDGLASNVHVPSSNVSCRFDTRNRQLRSPLRNVSAPDAIRNALVLPSTIDVAVIHLTIAIRAAKMQAEDAWDIAIEALKNMGITTIVRAAMEWMKSHPWETTALVIPLVLTACTPAFLGLAGFTAGGIATGLDMNIYS